uniref:Olfactory receptor n=1 Tax=Gopherus evgoodei TaxID=1825980 RepID=A0A8C4YA15_9SAUR
SPIKDITSSEDGNQSSLGEFILLGVSDWPQFELLLFVLILISYTMTLLGNTTIILVSSLDPHLHTPMYFFLSNLSFLDLCYTTSVGPQMLLNFRSTHKSISWAGCVAQLYIALSLGSTECLMLAIMAYDRYASICQPLRYTAIMSHRFCLQLAATAWLCSFGNSMLHTIRTMRLPRCGRNQIDSLFCEVPALLKLACVDTSANEAEVLASSVIILLVPLGFILMSYGYIGAAVLKISSAKGRIKAFNTCASHLAVVLLFYDTRVTEVVVFVMGVILLMTPVFLILVSYVFILVALRISSAEARLKAFSTCTAHITMVTLFCGTAVFMYMHPASSYSPERDKYFSFFYNVVCALLNPLIYSLRNKDVKGALVKLMAYVCWFVCFC